MSNYPMKVRVALRERITRDKRARCSASLDPFADYTPKEGDGNVVLRENYSDLLIFAAAVMDIRPETLTREDMIAWLEEAP